MTSEQNPALGRLTRRALIGAAVATPIAVKLARAQSTSASAGVELSNIKALTFDIQGTVVDYYQPLLRVGEELNQRKGLAIDWDKFSREWLAGVRPASFGCRPEDSFHGARAEWGTDRVRFRSSSRERPQAQRTTLVNAPKGWCRMRADS